MLSLELNSITIMLVFFLSGEMGPDFSPNMVVKSVTSQQMVRIHQLFRQAKFDDPSGDVSGSFVLAIPSELLIISKDVFLSRLL